MSSVPPSPVQQGYHDAVPGYRPMKTGRIVGIVLGLVLVVVLVLGGFVLAVFSRVRDSDATRSAVEAASRDGRIAAITGMPLVTGRFVSGHFNVTSNGRGEATLTIPVSGPNGRGNVYAVETRVGGVWQPTTLEFWPATNPNEIVRIVEPGSGAVGQ